jgi:hypothetical protein
VRIELAARLRADWSGVARFEEAVQLAEQAFTEEFSKLVSHLIERLSGSDDGEPKIFRDGVVDNLTEFFARFKQLNIRSHEQLDQLLERAQAIVRMHKIMCRAA